MFDGRGVGRRCGSLRPGVGVGRRPVASPP